MSNDTIARLRYLNNGAPLVRSVVCYVDDGYLVALAERVRLRRATRAELRSVAHTFTTGVAETTLIRRGVKGGPYVV